MVMKTILESLDDVDKALREHYVEAPDPKAPEKKQFVLAIEGSIDPLPGVKALRRENGDTRVKLRTAEETVKTLLPFKGMDPADVLAKLDRYPELEAAAEGKIDNKKLDDMVETRIKTRLAPLERQLQAVTGERDTFKVQLDTFSVKDKQRMISDEVRQAALKLKVEPTAVDDAIMYAERVMQVGEDGVVSVKDNVGFTPGLDVSSWLADMQPKRPHWWGPTVPGGAGGNNGRGGVAGGPNPWSFEHWNVTEQNKIYTADKKRAETLAVNAGTSLGGPKPKAKK